MDFSRINLRGGAGNGNPSDGLCLMQMVNYFAGEDRKISDHPKCASPALTAFGIRLNDTAPSQELRDTLWPLVFMLQDSRDADAENRRAEFLVIEVTKGPVADAFEALRLHEYAEAEIGRASCRERV